MPNDYSDERLRLVARLYYLDGLGQSEVAKFAKVSQAKVSRLLALAKERGIVRITVADYDRGAAAWGLLPPLLALPALCATSYGGAGAMPLLGALSIVVLAAVAGTAGRTIARRPWGALYLPAMLLLFAAPFALGYLVEEFGDASRAGAWRAVSPWVAAERVAESGTLAAPPCVLLLAWPACALAGRRR
jgi:hypothetical protein